MLQLPILKAQKLVSVLQTHGIMMVKKLFSYIKDEYASVARPVMELKGFKRIHLKKGESKTIEFDITPTMLTMLNKKMKHVVESGDFRIMTGSSSNDIRLRQILTVR